MENREKIVVAAAELFMRYGVRSVSMDDVARELGMSKKTLYQSFSNKDELVSATMQLHMEMEKSEFSKIGENSENAIDELHRLTGCIRRSMEGVNPSLLFDLQKYHPDAWKLFLDFKQNFIQSEVERNVKRGVKEGHYRSEINPTILAKIRVEVVQLVFDPKVFPTNEFNLVDVQMHVLDHFIHGLLSDEGRELYHQYQTNLKSSIEI